MKIISSVAEMQKWSAEEQKVGHTVGFVPTMGALHQGHAKLFVRSVSEQTRTVVSIFVNPLQFNSETDLAAYPRQLEKDIAIAEEQGVDVLFTPSHAEMYPLGFSSNISAGPIASHMEGLHRPGHFDGVATVVVKLLNAVAPTVSYFGEKDFQQVAVIRQVVRDLNIPCEVTSVPTVRDQFGLALSSRNTRLTAEHLGQARQIYILLSEIAEKCRTHETFSSAVKDRFTTELPAVTAATVEYVEVVDSNTLQPAQIASNGTTICVAVWFGDVRLIDNVSIGPALA